MLKDFLYLLASAWKDFIYPPICLHCKGQLKNPAETPIFCMSCLELVQLLEAHKQCRYCFSASDGVKRCNQCRKERSPYYRMAASFDYEGPMASLIHALKYGGQFYLAEGAAAYLAAQWLSLGWDKPDFLVPVPISMSRSFSRGYNQSLLLATALGKLIHVPTLDILSRTSEDYSQAGLNREQRQKLAKNSFQVKRNSSIDGTQLLIIDDVMTSRTTLKRCAQALLEGAYPDRLYALTLCRV